MIYTRAGKSGGDSPSTASTELKMYDPASGEARSFLTPPGSTWTIRGDSVFAQTGATIQRMGPDLTDWTKVADGTIEPIPGDVLLVFNCVSGEQPQFDPCSIEVYLDDGTLAALHERDSPLVQSGALFSSGLVRTMANRGNRFVQLINGGGGGMWDLDAGLLTTILSGPVTDAIWLPNDSGLIGRMGNSTTLHHVVANSGTTTELGVDLGRFSLLGVTGLGANES